jgi:hypothetical protein
MPRHSQLDLDVRISTHPDPDILSLHFCSIVSGFEILFAMRSHISFLHSLSTSEVYFAIRHGNITKSMIIYHTLCNINHMIRYTR